MGNPEKGPGKLGHEGRGNEKPNLKPNPADVAKKLGQTAIKGAQGKK
jgi:hypothetical protein